MVSGSVKCKCARKTREQVIESLCVGAQEMLMTDIPFEAKGSMLNIEIPTLSLAF